MDNKTSINYKTVAEFREAMRLAFRTAQGQSPDDPLIQSISERMNAALTALNAYNSKLGEDGSKPDANDEEFARLEKAALQSYEGAEIALKKWYSNQWLGRQSRRGVM